MESILINGKYSNKWKVFSFMESILINGKYSNKWKVF